MQPWHHRWATHRETEKVKAYYKVRKHLGYVNAEGVELMDCYIYSKSIDYKEQEETQKQEQIKEQEKMRQIDPPHSISLLTEEKDQDGSNPYCNIDIEGDVSR